MEPVGAKSHMTQGKRLKVLILVSVYLMFWGIIALTDVPSALSAKFDWLGTVGLLVGILTCIAGIGLLWLKEWARRLAIGSLGANILSQLVGLSLRAQRLSPQPGDFAMNLVGLIPYAMVDCVLFGLPIIYLTRPFMKARFRADPQ